MNGDPLSASRRLEEQSLYSSFMVAETKVQTVASQDERFIIAFDALRSSEAWKIRGPEIVSPSNSAQFVQISFSLKSVLALVDESNSLVRLRCVVRHTLQH